VIWPQAIREHLAESRRHGRPFDAAWEVALRAHPVPYGWTEGEVVPFTREVMRAGYNRQRLAGDATLLVEDAPSAKTPGERAPLAGGAPQRCRSSATCSAERADGSRFCARHRDELARVRAVFEAEEAERADGRRAARERAIR
jgi:hypothetical protein